MPKSTLSSNLEMDELAFDDNTPEFLKLDDFYHDWPVVYILNNDSEMYIGETYHAVERMKQHLKNEERRRLKKCRVFASNDFTKSATLDIESSLIELCSGDNTMQLQNANPGIVKHSYANKREFGQDSKLFEVLWNKLRSLGLVKEDIETIKNSDIFKYSPYKSLNAEQCTCRDYIIEDILEAVKNNEKKSIVVNGGAGTGKTILALYLYKLLITGADYINEDDKSETYSFINDIKEIERIKGRDLKVGYVVAMTSFRSTLQKVVREMSKKNKKLKKMHIIKPSDVAKDYYDVLIVDEAHRLKQSRALGSEIDNFYKTNTKLGFDKRSGNQLDWIMKQSQIQILFYDESQTIRPSDIESEYFKEVLANSDRLNLSTQMRCFGGGEYIEYIKNILNEKQTSKVSFKENYDFRLFDDINEFCDLILDKENKEGLSRIVSGYGFKWISDPKKKNNIHVNDNDIVINGRGFQWNKTNEKWPISISGKRVVEEVGCVHTIQGYDCNYCGVIFGPEIYYDGSHICIDKENYHDAAGKKTVKNDEELKDYIINIYSVLMSRGIKGTYVYVCDDKLREYFKKYM